MSLIFHVLFQVLSKDDPPRKTYVYKLDVPVNARWITLVVAPFEILPDPYCSIISHMCLPTDLPKLHNTVEFFHNAFRLVNSSFMVITIHIFCRAFWYWFGIHVCYLLMLIDWTFYFRQPLWGIPWGKISIWVIQASFLSSWGGSFLFHFWSFYEYI